MRRTALRAAVALLTFLIGVTAAALWYFHRPVSWRAADEDAITEAVILNAIRNMDAAKSRAVVCLSRGENADPTEGFMRRFGSYGARVKRLSQCGKTNSRVVDKDTGAPAVILKIQWVGRVGWDEAEVGVMQDPSPWEQNSFSCRVTRRLGAWTVRRCGFSYYFDQYV